MTNNHTDKYAESTFSWAIERTRLAKERTLAAWLRTGLGTTIAGVGLVKLLPNVHPHWLGLAIGLLLVFCGVATFILGFRAYYTVLKKLEREGYKGLPAWTIAIVTFSYILIAVMSLVLILLD